MLRPIVLLLLAFAAGGAAAQMRSVVDVIGSPRPDSTPRANAGGSAGGPQPPRNPEATQPVPVPGVAPPPAPLGSCDAGGCWDSQGRRYNGTGDGTRYLDSRGRLCTASGKFITCQ